MTYRVEIAREARKQIARLPKDAADRVLEVIQHWPTNHALSDVSASPEMSAGEFGWGITVCST